MVAKRFFVMAMHSKLFNIYFFFSILFFSHFCMGEIRGNMRSDTSRSRHSTVEKKKSVVLPKAKKAFIDSLKLKDYPNVLERNALFRAGDKINIRYASFGNSSKNKISGKEAAQILNANSTKHSLKNSSTQKTSEIPGWLAKLDKKENKSASDGENTLTKGIKFISFIINQHNSEIQDCYHDYLKISSNVRGRMVVRIFVNGNGQVEKVTIKESDIQDDVFKDRIIKIIKKWDDLGQGTRENKIYLQEYVFGE